MRKKVLIMVSVLMALFMIVPLALAGTDNGQGDENSRKVELRILAINDFHGNIATSSGSFGGTGRADYLATNVEAAKAGADNAIFVSAGDLIGASPLISALFHDEPTIEAMNLMGLAINAVGNHEFDEGPDELLRMQYGGSHPVDGDLDGDPFLGADFEFLAANVEVDATGDTIFPPYTIRRSSRRVGWQVSPSSTRPKL
jgi:5'-nucleotidase